MSKTLIALLSISILSGCSSINSFNMPERYATPDNKSIGTLSSFFATKRDWQSAQCEADWKECKNGGRTAMSGLGRSYIVALPGDYDAAKKAQDECMVSKGYIVKPE